MTKLSKRKSAKLEEIEEKRIAAIETVAASHITSRCGKIFITATIILLTIASIFTGHLLVNKSRHNAKVLGRKAYYLEEASGAGFLIRSYYDKKTGEILAESFGYRIMDDSVDLDNDGVDELLCTCEWGGDGKVEVLIYKSTEEGIMQGHFTPEGLHLDDIKADSSNNFICYYLPTSGEILGEYWTDECLKLIRLDYNQAIYKRFPQE